MNIEVFKTNVEDVEEAGRIIETIQEAYQMYKANFDLQDCDRILRIVSLNGPIEQGNLIALIKNSGYYAEVLPDY